MTSTERRHTIPLSDEHIEEIAERAADKAVAKIHAKFYQEVGKGVVNKFLAIVGFVVVGAYLWLSGHGYIK